MSADVGKIRDLAEAFKRSGAPERARELLEAAEEIEALRVRVEMAEATARTASKNDEQLIKEVAEYKRLWRNEQSRVQHVDALRVREVKDLQKAVEKWRRLRARDLKTLEVMRLDRMEDREYLLALEETNVMLVRDIEDVAMRSVDSALAEVRRQGGPDYLLTEARGDGLATAKSRISTLAWAARENAPSMLKKAKTEALAMAMEACTAYIYEIADDVPQTGISLRQGAARECLDRIEKLLEAI